MKLENIKIIAFDVDGTILPYTQVEVAPEIIKMFAQLKDKGYITVVATGRDMITIGTVANVPNIDYFIGANGAFIYDFKIRKIIYEAAFSYDDFLELEPFLEKNDLPFSVMTEKGGYNSKNFDLNNWFLEGHKDIFKPMSEIIHDKDQMHVITVKTTDESKIQKTKEFLEKNNLNMEINSTWRSGFFIAPKGITKAATIDRLAKMLGDWSIDKNAICFGDSSNDVEMIKQAAHGVVMANAGKYLQDLADAIAPDVELNGTKLYLEKIGVL